MDLADDPPSHVVRPKLGEEIDVAAVHRHFVEFAPATVEVVEDVRRGLAEAEKP
jgi:hypothetical protein